jgi:catechol 2,3-dioxygenase-like lactoylglutathione lyase family enzyme
MLQLKIGLLMLGVHNVERSLGFYRDRLGLRVQNQFPGFAFLDGGDGFVLALSEPLGSASDQLAGAAEVVLGVENVRAAYAELREQGIEFLNEPRNVNGTEWAANFRDPDGHLLSIYGPEGKA